MENATSTLPRQSRVGGVLELGDLREYTVDEDTGKEYYIDEATGDAKWREGTHGIEHY